MDEYELVEGIFSKPIRVKIEFDNSPNVDLWFVTSPDMRGLCIAKKTEEEARAAIPIVFGLIKQSLDAQNP